ncbi:hypothetical protein ACVBEF_05360 [Glaciimonas sp. GG7]
MSISSIGNTVVQWVKAEIQGSTTAKANRAMASGDAAGIAKLLKSVENTNVKMQHSVSKMTQQMEHYKSDLEYAEDHPENKRHNTIEDSNEHYARWDRVNEYVTLKRSCEDLNTRINKYTTIASDLKSATLVQDTSNSNVKITKFTPIAFDSNPTPSGQKDISSSFITEL